MNFLLTLQNVSVLFLLILIGYIAGKTNIVSLEGQSELSNLVLKVTMPATIILAMQMEYTPERLTTAFRITAIVIFAYIGMIILSVFISKIFNVADGKKDVIQIGLILPNTSFMGYPIVLSILGKEALFFAVLGAGLVFEFISWTYGIYTISRTTAFDFRKSLAKNIIFSPGILSIAIGLLLFILSIKIPEPIHMTMKMLGQATSPLAMLVVGILLSRSNIKECLISVKLYLIALTRLLVFPLLIFAVLKTFGFTGMEIIIPVVMLSMPTAAYVAMFSSNVGNDTNLASQIVFISSLLSLITIPIMVMLATRFA